MKQQDSFLTAGAIIAPTKKIAALNLRPFTAGTRDVLLRLGWKWRRFDIENKDEKEAAVFDIAPDDLTALENQIATYLFVHSQPVDTLLAAAKVPEMFNDDFLLPFKFGFTTMDLIAATPLIVASLEEAQQADFTTEPRGDAPDTPDDVPPPNS